MGRRPALVLKSLLVFSAWACGGASTGSEAAEPSAVEDEVHPTEELVEESEEPITEAPPAETERHIAVRWDQLADPHSLNALIVRTVDEWEELFVGAPPETIDFGQAIVIGVVQPEMASVHIDDVRMEGGEVVVSATVELPNASCGEAPLGALDMMVVEKVDAHIRFDLQRRTAEC